jgi:hypothetical protein
MASAPVFVSGAAVLDRSAVAIGMMAAAIAVGGFVGRTWQVFTNPENDAIQRMTLVGGGVGLCLAIAIVLYDAVAS